MADSLTQFNAFNYKTIGFKPTTTKTAAFTPDSDKVYLVRSGRAVNYDGANKTVSMFFYSGEDDVEYDLFETKSIAASELENLFIDHNIVIRGDLGDEIRVVAETDDTIDLTFTMMIVGRETGL